MVLEVCDPGCQPHAADILHRFKWGDGAEFLHVLQHLLTLCHHKDSPLSVYESILAPVFVMFTQVLPEVSSHLLSGRGLVIVHVAGRTQSKAILLVSPAPLRSGDVMGI